MACSNSSTEDNMEEESEIKRFGRENIERRAILDNLDNKLRELDLFDMNHNVSRDSEEEEMQDVSNEECFSDLNLTPSGIKFFSGSSNCNYDQKTIKAEMKQCSELDLQSLTELKDKALYGQFIGNSIDKEHPFRPLMKLLFTSQSRDYLNMTSEILILIMEKSGKVSSFLDIIISTLPVGLKNIEKLLDGSLCEVDKTIEVKNFNPVENMRYVLDVLQYSLRKAKLQLKGKLNMPDSTVDNLIFTLLTVSQDPQILSSNIIASIQNCLAEILDIYPSDCKYQTKVQDIVERIVLYWQDSPEDFSHVTAYTLCLNVIPLSRRGKQLKACLAYTSLNYCLPSLELSILDRVTLYQLSKFCRENVSEISLFDCRTLYSVIQLIDAAIMRPVIVDQDEIHVNSLLRTVNEINSQKSSPLLKEDYYYKSKFVSLVSEITKQWSKLLVTGSSKEKNLY
ncbi:hypothetical protein Avbf_15833 [Armadillidium vulgare]|nr:hypothetical protein Avbf_15833 [Armadillidium vulgare]